MNRIYRPTAPGAAAPPEREHSARDERSSKGYATVEDQAVVVVRDATYARPGYRSFEFADLEVRPGEVALVLSLDHAPARDLALAVAGLVRPTSGSIAVCGRELASRPGHPVCAGLAADEAEAVLADLSRFARDRAVAVVTASTEPALAERADVVCALGVDAAEAVSPRAATSHAATPRAASGSVDSKGVDLS